MAMKAKLACVALFVMVSLIVFMRVVVKAPPRQVGEVPSTAVDPGRDLDRHEDRADVAKRMRTIASRHLHVGMEGAEVEQVLAASGIRLMFTDSSSVRVNRFYGTGDLADPVLIVAFRRGIDQPSYVREWEVQE